MARNSKQKELLIRQMEMFRKLFDNMQKDVECSIQCLDILQEILSKPEIDVIDKNLLITSLAMLRLHFYGQLNTILKLKYET